MGRIQVIQENKTFMDNFLQVRAVRKLSKPKGRADSTETTANAFKDVKDSHSLGKQEQTPVANIFGFQSVVEYKKEVLDSDNVRNYVYPRCRTVILARQVISLKTFYPRYSMSFQVSPCFSQFTHAAEVYNPQMLGREDGGIDYHTKFPETMKIGGKIIQCN